MLSDKSPSCVTLGALWRRLGASFAHVGPNLTREILAKRRQDLKKIPNLVQDTTAFALEDFLIDLDTKFHQF